MLRGILAVVWKECRGNPRFCEWPRECGLRTGFASSRHSDHISANVIAVRFSFSISVP